MDLNEAAEFLQALLNILETGAVYASVVLLVSTAFETLPGLKQIWEGTPSGLKQPILLVAYVGTTFVLSELACGGADLGLGVPCFDNRWTVLWAAEIILPGVAFYLGSQLAFPAVKTQTAKLRK